MFFFPLNKNCIFITYFFTIISYNLVDIIIFKEEIIIVNVTKTARSINEISL